jgi:hypothetical protein
VFAATSALASALGFLQADGHVSAGRGDNSVLYICRCFHEQQEGRSRVAAPIGDTSQLVRPQ